MDGGFARGAAGDGGDPGNVPTDGGGRGGVSEVLKKVTNRVKTRLQKNNWLRIGQYKGKFRVSIGPAPRYMQLRARLTLHIHMEWGKIGFDVRILGRTYTRYWKW